MAAGRASSASAGNPFKLTLPSSEPTSRVAVKTCYCTDSTHRSASIISISWEPFPTHSPISVPGWQLEPAIGRVPRAAGQASSASAGNPFKLTLLNPQQGGSRASIISISWKPFQTHSPISGPLNLNPQQGGSWNLLLDGFHALQGEHHQHQLETLSNSLSHFRSSEQGGSWNLLLDGFHAPQGEHHQHQLETLSNSLSHFRSSEPTAGWQLEPAIARVPRAAGRASSASAVNPFNLTLPFPVL